MIIVPFTNGIAICGDSTTREVFDVVQRHVGKVPFIIADPPYGNILATKWDKTSSSDEQFVSWMIDWTHMWSELLLDRGSFNIWAGIGKPGFRPMYRYIPAVERLGAFELAAHITWKKRRAYGTKTNYLFVREELLWFVKGEAKKPLTFNVPYLKEERGYVGFNKKYPALDSRYRRTCIWTDVTEIMQGKVHVAQKAQRVIEIPIEVHTNPGEFVVDPFAGSGTTALAAWKLGRNFVVIEKDQKTFDMMVARLKAVKVEDL